MFVRLAICAKMITGILFTYMSCSRVMYNYTREHACHTPGRCLTVQVSSRTLLAAHIPHSGDCMQGVGNSVSTTSGRKVKMKVIGTGTSIYMTRGVSGVAKITTRGDGYKMPVTSVRGDASNHVTGREG